VWKTMCMADATPMFRHYFLSQLRWWLGAYLGESRHDCLFSGVSNFARSHWVESPENIIFWNL
jgi:hypothetical protein